MNWKPKRTTGIECPKCEGRGYNYQNLEVDEQNNYRIVCWFCVGSGKINSPEQWKNFGGGTPCSG